MAEPFIAEIRIFAGNFAPRNWAFCDGQLLPIAQNTALFSLVGTTYGGDGRTSLGLPNLQGRAPMHPGNGPGLSPRRLGESGGNPTHSLTVAQMPSHNHSVKGTYTAASTSSGSGRLLAATSENAYGVRGSEATLATASVGSAGDGQPHNNRQPLLVLNFIIALLGLYPSRS